MVERLTVGQFDVAMRQLAQDCEAATGVRPNGLYKLIRDFGGVGAAHRLLTKEGVSANFGRLAAIGRLDLAVENLVLDPRCVDLFDERCRNIARNRVNNNDGDNA